MATSMPPPRCHKPAIAQVGDEINAARGAIGLPQAYPNLVDVHQVKNDGHARGKRQYKCAQRRRRHQEGAKRVSPMSRKRKQRRCVGRE